MTTSRLVSSVVCYKNIYLKYCVLCVQLLLFSSLLITSWNLISDGMKKKEQYNFLPIYFVTPTQVYSLSRKYPDVKREVNIPFQIQTSLIQ